TDPITERAEDRHVVVSSNRRATGRHRESGELMPRATVLGRPGTTHVRSRSLRLPAPRPAFADARSRCDAEIGLQRDVRATRYMLRGVRAPMTADQVLSTASGYLNSFTLDERRRSGTVYTPEALVRLILDLADCKGEELENGPILDPACGAAVFLCEVLQRAA